MTMSNTFAGKLGVAFVAIAMALMMVAPAKAAQTPAELQAQIDTLMATITALQAQLGVTTPAASASAYVFTRPLTIGSQGADVTALQNYLIAGGHAIPAGATGYFGAQTAAAVAAWQTANGVMPASGYFGPLSQAKYAALMAAVTPTTPTTPTTPSTSGLGEGEADLTNFKGADGDDTDLEEGQEDAPVAEFSFKVKDGDVKVNRMDVTFVADNANDESDPWNTFDTVSLWVDGEQVASEDASDEDNWMDDEPVNGENTLRFTGLDDSIFRDGDVAEIVVGVTVQNSVDGTNDGEDWTVYVDEDGIRAVDGEGVDQYTGDDGETVDFTIDEQGGDDELIVKSASEDPNSTTIAVDDEDKSDFTTVFAYTIDTKDSVNDITVDTIVVHVKTDDAGGTDDVVSDAKLVIDGNEYDDWTIGAANALDTTYTFDLDKDLTIDAGDKVVAEFQVEFKGLTGNYAEGTSIMASTTGAEYEAEGADDLEGAQLSGTATGDTHTLRTEGAILEPGNMTGTKDANSDTTVLDDEGVFTVKFDVTAFESDLWINKSAASGTVMGTNGVNYRVTNGSGVVVGTTTPTQSLSSTAETDGTRFKVAEGETETFTLTVTVDPGTQGFYGVQLYSLNFATTNANPTTQQRALPASDYETDPLSI